MQFMKNKLPPAPLKCNTMPQKQDFFHANPELPEISLTGLFKSRF